MLISVWAAKVLKLARRSHGERQKRENRSDGGTERLGSGKVACPSPTNGRKRPQRGPALSRGQQPFLVVRV
jgi:hypothetical protein